MSTKRKLEVGDQVNLHGKDGWCRVTRVSDCSASLVPIASTQVAFQDHLNEKRVAFTASKGAKTIHIAPEPFLADEDYRRKTVRRTA